MEQVAATIVAERAEEDPWLATFAEHLIGKSETSTRDCLGAIGILPANQTRAHGDAGQRGDPALGWAISGRFNSGPNRNLTRYVRPQICATCATCATFSTEA